MKRYNNFILEKSYFISDSNDYGSFEGIVHSDIDKIKKHERQI